MTKNVYILGGGTFSHVRSHLALCAPAFGGTARAIYDYIYKNRLALPSWNPIKILTKMADHHSPITTNEDVEREVDKIIDDVNAGVVFFNVALCDFTGQIGAVKSGKYAERLKSREGPYEIQLSMADKIISKIRKHRKDIYLVAFKTTAGASEQEQYVAGLNLLKANSCNVVFANDLVTRRNMVIVPEEAKYCSTTNRTTCLEFMIKMVARRSQLHFTRSTVVPGESIDWNGPDVPESLRTVVNYCIERGAYKPFRGSTAGHFAYKVDDNTFITSKRKTNYNNLDQVGMVKVVADGPDNVIAYGAKPSVGGQSQRIIFKEHPEMDCIVHFHCHANEEQWFKPNHVPLREQLWFECGSHECGKNTSDGLKEVVPGIKAVYLDEHGPNIVFNRNEDPQRVISFIDDYFDLDRKTGGPVALQA